MNKYKRAITVAVCGLFLVTYFLSRSRLIRPVQKRPRPTHSQKTEKSVSANQAEKGKKPNGSKSNKGPVGKAEAPKPPETVYAKNIDFVRLVDDAIAEGIKRNSGDLRLTEGDKKYLLSATRAVLENRFSANPKEMTEADFKNIPKNVSAQTAQLYVTLLANSKVRGCQSSSKKSLLGNAIRATYRAIDDQRFNGVLTAEESSDTIIDITILLNPVGVNKHKIRQIKREIELGIHAISLQRGKKKAFYKSSVPVSHAYSLKETLKRLGKKAKIGEQAYQKKDTKIRRYNTIQFAEKFEDKSLVDLYRSNPLICQSDVTEDSQRAALRLCADYMKNHVDPNGLMTYEYDTYNDKKSQSMSTSAVVRRLAGTWILASAGAYFNDSECKAAAKRSIDYFLGRYYVHDTERNFGYIRIAEDANIAMAAFMLLALVELDDKEFHPAEKEQLLSLIFAMEDKEKGFLYPVYLPDRQANFEKKEIYYPGEALTAVMTYYEATRDHRCLALAERLFDYYRALYERTSKKASLTPWVSKAYAKVFVATQERKYADFLFTMNDYLLKGQRDVDEEYVDKIGCFFSKGASYSTGVMVEAVAEAYKVAKMLGDKERMEAYRRSVLMGNRFLMQCQFTNENMFTAKDHRLTLGGVRTFIYTSKVRIDSVQHAACALQKSLEHIYQ